MKKILTIILCAMPFLAFSDLAIVETKEVNSFLSQIKQKGYVLYNIKESASGQSWQITYVTQAQFDALASIPAPGQAN